MTTFERSMALLLAVLVLGACGSGGDLAGSPSPSVGNTRPASTAKLTVIEPAFDATVKGPTVNVKLALGGATIATKASTTLRPDTGHVHVNLDGRTLTLLAGLTYTIEDVEPGEHLLRVEFAANDHGSFNPPVLVDVRFTVE